MNTHILESLESISSDLRMMAKKAHLSDANEWKRLREISFRVDMVSIEVEGAVRNRIDQPSLGIEVIP